MTPSVLQVAWGTLAAFPYHMDMFELGAILGAEPSLSHLTAHVRSSGHQRC